MQTSFILDDSKSKINHFPTLELISESKRNLFVLITDVIYLLKDVIYLQAL